MTDDIEFTTAEKLALKALAAAYSNAKTIDDLTVIGNNVTPSMVTVEVAVDGASKKTDLKTLLDREYIPKSGTDIATINRSDAQYIIVLDSSGNVKKIQNSTGTSL